MVIDGEAQQDVVADYWRAYFEWRAAYGLSDVCMGELLAALRVECSAPGIGAEQQAKLHALARMIELEISSQGDVCRAA